MAKPFDPRKQTGFATIALATLVLLYLPIALLVGFSFNSTSSIAVWQGFSWRWYQAAWANDQVQQATLRSLLIAAWASGLATLAAIGAALALQRGPAFRGQSLIFALINQPLMVPEIITATALLILVATLKIATGYTGLAYLILAHAAFCIPFAYMPIRARLQAMDPQLEQAAADLYASPLAAFRHVTLPQLWPGVLAGMMLAFVISLDDVVITEFLKSAGQDTLPTYMLGQLRREITPEINAISTALLALSVALVLGFFWLGRNRR